MKRKQATADVFGRAAATYDSIGPHYFSVLSRRLVELAAVPDGARVLDVASGRGAVLVPAAEQEETSEFTYAGADEWWQSQWSHGGRGALESVSADALARFRHDVYERLDALRTTCGQPVRLATLFSLAVK